MRRLLLLLLLLGATVPAADIHVAAGGSDGTGDGSQGAPYATAAKGLSLAGVGDRVLLRRGDVFREGGLAVGSGRTLGAWGEGADPVLSGSTAVGGFSPGGGGVYQASLDLGGRETELCFVDGARLTLARYPDSGWLRTAAGTTGDALACTELTGARAAGHWQGAKVRWRRWSWWFETRGVTGDDGAGNLALAARDFGAPDNVGIGSGFYLDSLLAECDAPGEWCHDAGAGQLHVYPPAASDPASMLVEIVTRDEGVALGGGRVEGVAFRHYNVQAIRVGNPSVVDGCLVEHCVNGLAATWNAGGSEIVDCTFRDLLNNGITWNENPAGAGGTHIHGCRFERIGVVPGHGGSGSWHASACVITNGNAVTFTGNRVERCGYAGIILGSDGQVVDRNFFRHCLETLNDGAAIYTNSHANVITDNIVLETIGNFHSSQPWYPLGHGIWPEFLSGFTDHVITGNTVYGCGGNGLFLTNNFTATVSGNTLLSNRLAGLHCSGDAGFPTDQGHVIDGNVLGIGAVPYAAPGPENPAEWNHLSDFARGLRYVAGYDYGTMAGNTLVRPSDAIYWITEGNTAKAIATWQAEQAAWADPDIAAVTGAAYLFINDTDATGSFPLPAGIAWQRLDGSPAEIAVTLAPCRSLVLIAGAGDTEGLDGYHLLSRQLPTQVICHRTGRDVIP